MEEKKTIVLIGPVYPFKGGISHYTGLMYRALTKKFDVSMLSYKMQYPKLLFKKEQRDYSNDTFKIEDTDYGIHTANPFNWIRVAKQIRKRKPDLVVFQWWHPYFAPCYQALCSLIGKKIPKLFVCHNVFPHERFPMDKLLTKLTLKKGNYYIVQSKQDEEDLKTIRNAPNFRRTVHPTYNAFKMRDISMEEGRKELAIAPEKKVLLFFGFIRPYKGLKYLLDAMPSVRETIPEVQLFVVGDFANAEEKESYVNQIKANHVEDCVAVYDGYIPDQEVEKFFAASDLVVLPYESATQSGIVQIAYGFEKPVVATNVGGLPDVVTDGKTGYVVEAKNSAALAEAIARFFTEERAAEFHEHILAEAEKYSWDRMTEIVESFLEEK